MANNAVEPFEQAWPDLERRLRAMLARRGVRAWCVDDIVQETAARMFEAWDDVDPERGPWPFAATIAKNLLWDERNRRQPREVVGAVPDTPADCDVERAGLARVEIGRVNRALARLNHNYRSILLAEIGEPLSLEGEPRAINVLRMRARQRLVAVLDKGSALVGVPAAAKSRLANVAGFVRRNPSAGDASAAAVALAVTLVTLSGAPDTQRRLLPRGDAITRHDAINTLSSRTNDQVASRLTVDRVAGSAESAPAAGAEAVKAVKDVKDATDDIDAFASVGEDGPVEATVAVEYPTPNESGPQNAPPRCDVEPTASGAKAGCRVRVLGREGGARARVKVGGSRP